MLSLFIILCSVLLILMKTEIIVMSKAEEDVILTANSRRLSVRCMPDKYDGEANYTYEDGEELEFSCKPFSWHSTNSMRLEYYNAEGIRLFKTKPRNKTKHIFRSVLTSKNNKYYLDCVLRRDYPEQEYSYRTTFYLMERDVEAETVDHAMILSVNNHDLTVTSNRKELHYDDYVFRYIDGELLHVTCRKADYFLGGTLTFTYQDFNNVITSLRRFPLARSSTEISLNVSSASRGKILNCGIANTGVHNPNARLLFVSDLPENDVRIRGLPRNNILYQYTNDENQWTIEYQYAVNETLDLTCVGKGPITPEEQLLEWEFNGKSSVTATTSSFGTMTIVSKQTFTKTLNATDNTKKIRCIYIPNTTPKTIEIILRLKSKANRGENISTDNQDKAGEYSPLILGSSIGAVLVVLGMAGVAYILCIRSRSNIRRNIENSYGDLTNHNGGQKPQNSDRCEDQYDTCYADNQSEIYYEISAEVGNIVTENRNAEIDNSSCKPKMAETINNLIYDEPYPHLTMGKMNTLHGV